MHTTIVEGIKTNYEVVGNGPPILKYSPGGFDATLDKWSTLGVYARIKLLDHLPRNYSCILFDRRETGQSGGRVERISWMTMSSKARDCWTISGFPKRIFSVAAWVAAR